MEYFNLCHFFFKHLIPSCSFAIIRDCYHCKGLITGGQEHCITHVHRVCEYELWYFLLEYYVDEHFFKIKTPRTYLDCMLVYFRLRSCRLSQLVSPSQTAEVGRHTPFKQLNSMPQSKSE